MHQFMMTTAYYGSHVSHSKEGLLHAIESVRQNGGNTLQIMVSSPLNPRPNVSKYQELGPLVREKLREHNMKLFIHAPYTLNFAKDPHEKGAYWINAMLTELRIADLLGAKGCVLHMGKAVNLDQATAERNFHTSLVTLIDRMKENNVQARILIETSAGQGTELYPTLGNLNDLERFFDQFSTGQRQHIGLCVDTCHIFAAGYPIHTPEQVDVFFQEFDEKIGLQHLDLVHLNNSIGCRVDRHACLEYGKITPAGLFAFARQSAAKKIPIILETPEAIKELTLLGKILS